jgi:ABC-type molybdate transport system substrate-binding protein
MWKLVIAALFLAVPAARADDLVVYGAGSLRESIGEIAKDFARARGIAVSTQFGPSGRMRERIENGEHVDLFTSADVGHPRKLVNEGRAQVMAVFARNTVCLLSPPKFAATTDTLLDKLLSPGTRIGMSAPKIDPLGDYTLRLFEMIDHMHPGSAASLQARATVLDTPPGATPPKSGDIFLDAILEGRADTGIVYCSGRDRYARLLPDATMVQFPADLQVGPEYGLAVLNGAQPAAMLLALTILSPEGQKIMLAHGFQPVTLPEGLANSAGNR